MASRKLPKLTEREAAILQALRQTKQSRDRKWVRPAWVAENLPEDMKSRTARGVSGTLTGLARRGLAWRTQYLDDDFQEVVVFDLSVDGEAYLISRAVQTQLARPEMQAEIKRLLAEPVAEVEDDE